MGPGSVLGGLTPNVRGPSTVLEGPDSVLGGPDSKFESVWYGLGGA